MTKRLILALAATGMSFPSAGPAIAQAATQPGSTDAGKVVCRQMPQTGSRLYKRDCRTAAGWDRMSEEHRRGASEMIDRPFLPDCRNNPPC